MIKPFRISVSQSVLDDLMKRIDNTRWPNEIENKKWELGTNKSYLKELCDYWLKNYNWREQEALLNKFKWFTADIDGDEIILFTNAARGLIQLRSFYFKDGPILSCATQN